MLDAEADISVADAGPLSRGILRGARRGPASGLQAPRIDATYEPGGSCASARSSLSGSGGLSVKGEGTVTRGSRRGDILAPGPSPSAGARERPRPRGTGFPAAPGVRPHGGLRADLGVTGSWKEPDARLEIHGERLQLPPGTRFVPPGPYALSGTLTWGKAEARTEKVRLESPALSCSALGRLVLAPVALVARLPERRHGDGDALPPRLVQTRRTSAGCRSRSRGSGGCAGAWTGEIAVEGPADDPVVSGVIRVAQGAFRYQDLPTVDALTARASVARRIVTLEEFGGSVGGSPFTLAGSVDLSRLEDPVLDLRLLGKNALLYRAEGFRIRADNDLTLRGPVSALSLAGEVALTDSVYQKSFSVASLFSGGGKSEKGSRRPSPGLAGISFPEPPLRDLRFDVRLTARQPFRILTSAVQGAARPDLRLTGTGLLPRLRGPILFDATQVALPSGALEFESGLVLFNESAPGRSTLDFVGRMQTQGLEITAQIGGTLDKPEVILSSVPPVFQEELLLFVLTGAPPGSANTGGGYVSAMATPMAVYLGKGALEQLLGGELAGRKQRSPESARGAGRPGADAERGHDHRRAPAPEEETLQGGRRPVPHEREGHLRPGERRNEDAFQVQVKGVGMVTRSQAAVRGVGAGRRGRALRRTCRAARRRRCASKGTPPSARGACSRRPPPS